MSRICENFLYLMTLTGQEIKDYLEYSYDLWMNQMSDENDHLLNFREYDEVTGNYELATGYYNYDSAAGIVYAVDVTKPKGERILIPGMDANLDGIADEGSVFDLDREYTCAINSYRCSGGGGHLLGAGLTREAVDSESRKVAQTERDLRYHLMADIRSRGTVSPETIGQWKAVPEDWAMAGMIRDYDILYHQTPNDTCHFS